MPQLLSRCRSRINTDRDPERGAEGATILDKTVEKIVYLDSIFLKIVAVPVLPSPPSPESNVVMYSKESLIPGRLWEATLNRGKGFSSRKGVVLEIVLLRRKVDMMGKTFSSSFVRDWGGFGAAFCAKIFFSVCIISGYNLEDNDICARVLLAF